MALWKDKRRKDWRYEFKHLGKRYTGSGFKTKGAAREAREAKRKDVKSQKTQTGTAFSTVSNSYLDYAERRFTKKTFEYKAYVFKSFLRYYKQDFLLEEITPQTLHQYLNSRPTNHNYNAHRKDLCTLFTFARRQLKINIPHPCWDLEKMPYSPPKKDLIPQGELLKLLIAADPETEKPLLLVLLHTLARVDEALRLTWEDVIFEQRIVTLWTRKRKGGAYEPDDMPMNDDLYDVLWRQWQTRKQDKWVFYNEKTDDRFNRRPKLMPGLCKRAGIKSYGFHHLRHFMATYLVDKKKISKKAVSGLLRHRNLGTTELYFGSVDESQRIAMKAVEGVFRDEKCMAPNFVLLEKTGTKTHKQAE